MCKCIHISEVNKSKEISPIPILLNELKITNTSSQFIRDLKLIIHESNNPILEQCVTRERGKLSFEPQITCLELGNLAPDESAYFEYKFTSQSQLTSLATHFSLSYTETDTNGVDAKKIVEHLPDSTIS